MDGSGEGQMIVKCSGEVQVRVRGNSEVNMGGRQTCFTCVWSIVLRPDLTRQKHNPNRKMFTFFSLDTSMILIHLGMKVAKVIKYIRKLEKGKL